jgi:hypothetical protein
MWKSVLTTTLLLLATVTFAGDSIVVSSVISGSPAEAAGLQENDHLVELAGKKITSQVDLQDILAAHKPGDTVPLTVERGGSAVDLSLTFGERPDGGVSIGIHLAIMRSPDGAPGEASEGTVECLTWIEETYRAEAMIKELELEFADDYKALLECVQRDTQQMSTANAVQYCDNVFKVHCSALDLLTEIGEAQVERCEQQLSASLGLNLNDHEGWTRCAEQSVFERYSMQGQASDEATCRSTLLNDCGTHLATSDQPSFTACCSAETLDREACPMIDDGFSRGPCLDRPVCVNRLTSEWIECSSSE